MDRARIFFATYLPTCFLLAILFVLGGLWLRFAEIQSQVTKAIERKEQNMQQITSTWTSGSVEHEVTTVRNAGESVDDFTARHNELFEAQKTLYPPD